jgi:dTDP-4-dehydrorhamnose reductase
MKVLIFGVTGLLGNTLYRFLSLKRGVKVYGTFKSYEKIKILNKKTKKRNFFFLDKLSFKNIAHVINKIKPDYVINCIGAVKQRLNYFKKNFEINIFFSKNINTLSRKMNFNLIHISSDCVFSGKKGFYNEKDLADAKDLYGKSKLLGEVYGPNTITLRTSIIGHELNSSYGLLEWFIKQEKINGYKNVFFSGFPTVILSELIYNKILKNSQIKTPGLYHLGSRRISKLKLLNMINRQYKMKKKIISFNSSFIDRSLISKKFKRIYGNYSYSWPNMIKRMYVFK